MSCRSWTLRKSLDVTLLIFQGLCGLYLENSASPSDLRRLCTQDSTYAERLNRDSQVVSRSEAERASRTACRKEIFRSRRKEVSTSVCEDEDLHEYVLKFQRHSKVRKSADTVVTYLVTFIATIFSRICGFQRHLGERRSSKIVLTFLATNR